MWSHLPCDGLIWSLIHTAFTSQRRTRAGTKCPTILPSHNSRGTAGWNKDTTEVEQPGRVNGALVNIWTILALSTCVLFNKIWCSFMNLAAGWVKLKMKLLFYTAGPTCNWLSFTYNLQFQKIKKAEVINKASSKQSSKQWLLLQWLRPSLSYYPLFYPHYSS